ncbi:hypothetical protein BDW02DRAFT_267359 [Decorospora gaudefroyi]|uniref:RING-type domain-containing protein n=1 Tax=Decorospora gaudefroyi TaxID=184978 RepID=A0A6A5KQF3_9PLEO|nr:hypothetical protein BDW02DRAFT_267359 [Decorospora gaudefroyi]
MENFLNTQLHPADTCNICTEHFSDVHQPVALPCKHIFGHECIKKWLKSGRGNTNACPTCRYICVPEPQPNLQSRAPFDVPSIWKELCELSPDRLNEFISYIWTGLRALWQQYPTGIFTVTSILDEVLIPALLTSAQRTNIFGGLPQDPIRDCYGLVAASWDSLGRPDRAVGLAIPLVRLARLMASTGAVLPRWLTDTSRTNRLIWQANACLPITEDNISWEHIMEAADLKNNRYLPLLHLYTVLVSQSISHQSFPGPWPKKRHEMMNLVVERCCTKIGGAGWKNKPSNGFKDKLVGVFEELRRWQLEKGKMSLRGHDVEDSIVKGIWALAGWK